MEKIRIGNDFAIEWSIYQDLDGEVSEYNLEGKKLVLKCVSPFSTIETQDFTVSGNVLTWNFYGKDQKATGNYSLILEENKGNIGMVTVDVVSAFALVQHSKDEQKEDNNPNVTIDKVTLSSRISFTGCVIPGGGGGSIDPELLEGFIPMTRDFSDDFNNDFAR